MIESLEECLNGRYTKKTVKHPETGAVIIGPNELITEDKAREIVNAGVEEVTIRSVFTCNTRHGVCRHCYVSTWRLVIQLRSVKQSEPSLPNLSRARVHD